jgi:hypothetical protein
MRGTVLALIGNSTGHAFHHSRCGSAEKFPIPTQQEDTARYAACGAVADYLGMMSATTDNWWAYPSFCGRGIS